jgi:hypothetical protein
MNEICAWQKPEKNNGLKIINHRYVQCDAFKSSEDTDKII